MFSANKRMKLEVNTNKTSIKKMEIKKQYSDPWVFRRKP